MSEERITGVAIMQPTGAVWALPATHRHGHVFALAAFLDRDADAPGSVQGFMTSAGRFVDRREAMLIARSAGQTTMMREELFSEDVW